MYELKKNGKVFTSKSVGTGPSSYEKRICQAAVSQMLRNTGLEQRIQKLIHFCRSLFIVFRNIEQSNKHLNL